jgi:hypothetical protein
MAGWSEKVLDIDLNTQTDKLYPGDGGSISVGVVWVPPCCGTWRDLRSIHSRRKKKPVRWPFMPS